jgi:hypothetical protein
MADRVYHATGQVIDGQTNQGLPELTVEAWDSGQTTSQPLAVTVTENDGRFNLELDFRQFGFKVIPDVIFKVLRNGVPLEGAESAVSWNANTEENVTILVTQVPKHRSEAKDRITARQFLKVTDFFQQSNFLGVATNVAEKVGTRWGTIGDALANTFIKSDFKPVKPGRNFEKEVVNKDVNTVRKNLESEKIEVNVLPYNPRLDKATFADLTSFPSNLKAGQKINLHEKDGIVKYISVVKETKSSEHTPAGEDKQKEELKKLAEELKTSREDSLRKDKQISELQQELLSIRKDHVEIKKILKSKGFETVSKTVGKKGGEGKPK